MTTTSPSTGELKALQAKVSELTSQLQLQTSQNSSSTQKLQQLIEDNTRKTLAENKQKAIIMEELVRSNNARELSELRHSLALSSSRLGTLKYERVGGGISGERLVEVWEDGFAARKLKENLAALKERRALLERRQKEAKKQVKKLTSQQKSGEMPPPPPKVDAQETGGMVATDELEAMEAEESVRAHLGALKKREADLAEEEKLLETEKIMHLRALKRVANEDASRFQSRPKLHDRYLLLNLLGKGGFSEVWRAHDMEEFRDVAVKIHQLDARWSEVREDGERRRGEEFSQDSDPPPPPPPTSPPFLPIYAGQKEELHQARQQGVRDPQGRETPSDRLPPRRLRDRPQLLRHRP